jgi:hypothetical protein
MHSPITCRSVGRALPLIVGAGFQLAVGCADPTAAIPFPLDAVEITPAAPYARWWAMTESCSGRSGDLSGVHFYAVPQLTIDVDHSGYRGYWFQRGSRIVLNSDRIEVGLVTQGHAREPPSRARLQWRSKHDQ